MVANPPQPFKAVRSNRRATGPVDMQLVQLMAVILAAGVMVVGVSIVVSLILDESADRDQFSELKGLVHEIKLVCQGNSPRNVWFTVKPGRGIVFIRDLSDIERDKIVDETGCQQYCLCAIRRDKDWDDYSSKDYYAYARFLSNDADEQLHLRNLIADDDTKIIGCSNLLRAVPGETACFQDVVLKDTMDCDECSSFTTEKLIEGKTVKIRGKTMFNYWGLPLRWDPSGLIWDDPHTRMLAILKQQCAWNTKLKLETEGTSLVISSWIFDQYAHSQDSHYYTTWKGYKPCTFFYCHGVVNLETCSR